MNSLEEKKNRNFPVEFAVGSSPIRLIDFSLDIQGQITFVKLTILREWKFIIDWKWHLFIRNPSSSCVLHVHWLISELSVIRFCIFIICSLFWQFNHHEKDFWLGSFLSSEVDSTLVCTNRSKWVQLRDYFWSFWVVDKVN